MSPRKLRLVTDAEWAEIVKRRQSAAFLDSVSRQFDASRKKRFAAPHPGFTYRCKECGLGTNCDDGICVGCAF